MHLFLHLLLILTLATFLFLLIQKSNKRVHKQPPGPPGLPLIGNLHQLASSCPHLWLHEISKKYGPIIYLKLGFRPTLVVSSAKMAKEVLKTLDHAFCSRPTIATLKKLTYDGLDIVFAPYGDSWREFKKVRSFSSVREEEVCNMMKEISRLSHEDKVVNLSEMIISLTSSVICRIAFGRKHDCGGKNSCRRSFQELINDAKEMSMAFSFSDYFYGMGWIDKITGLEARLNKLFMEFDSFYEEVIEEHINTMKNTAKSGREDLVDVLLKMQRDGSLGFNITNNHIKAILVDVFIGGTDTSASTIVWLMTELMKHPKAMGRLQEEIRRIGMRNKTSDKIIKAEDFEKLMYLKAVVKETLRLHPIAPLLIPRETIQKCTIEEYEIQEKTLVYVNARTIARDPEIWENPEEFIPERFLGGKTIDFRGQGFELLPFGSGRRICPGRQMGLAMVELAVVNLICLFDWRVRVGMEEDVLDMTMSLGLAVHKKTPLCLVAKNVCC